MSESLTPVPFLSKIGYGTGHVLNDMCAAMWFTYLLIFFHKVLGFQHILAGALLTIGQFADGISTVFVGVFSDKGDNFWLCNQYGNRKSWHLVGTACVVWSFPFIFLPCLNCKESSYQAQMVYYSAFIIIFQFGWAAVQISHLAMIPDLTSCENEYTTLTSIRYAATVISTLIVYGAMWCWLGIGKDNDTFNISDAPIFRNVAFVSIGFGGLCSCVFHILVKLRTPVRDEEAASSGISDIENRDIPDILFHGEDGTVAPLQANTDQSPPTSATITQPMHIIDWLCEPQFYQVACLYMCTRLFVNASQVYMPFYLNVTLKLKPTYVAIIPMVMYVSGIFIAIVIKSVTKRVGKKFAYGISCILGGTGCLWMHWGCRWDDEWTGTEIYIVAAFIGSGGAAMLITSLSITADLIGRNKESSAFIYGAMSLVDKVSNGVAIMLIQHFVPPHLDDCPSCRLYFETVLVWICGSFAIGGLASVISLIPSEIGRRRREQQIRELMDDEAVLPENMETESHNDSDSAIVI